MSSSPSSTTNNSPPEERNKQKKPINILFLHGKGGSANRFQQHLQPLLQHLETQFLPRPLSTDFIDAPHPGGQWWTLPPGVRSFNAKEYEGFDKSVAAIQRAMSVKDYDVIVGHSQGAILMAAMMADIISGGDDEEQQMRWRAPKGLILNGAAWPNPYGAVLEKLTMANGGCGGDDDVLSLVPKVLFVMGERDDINPIEGAERVRSVLERAGMSTMTCRHGGGHSVPVNDERVVREIGDWMRMVVDMDSFVSKI